MASLDEETNEIERKPVLSSEGILYDVLPGIFKYLNARDLCKAAGVSPSWNKAVQVELSKRTIQCLKIEAEISLWDEGSVRIKNYLRNKPCHSLIFFDDKSVPYVDVSYNIVTRYPSAVLDSSFSVIKTLGASIDEIPILGKNNDALGIFIPSNSRINVKTHVPDLNYDIIDYPDDNPNLLTEILEELINNDLNHYCIIIFNLVLEYDDESTAESMRRFSGDILRELRRRYKPGKFSLWGGSVRSMKTSGYNVHPYLESCWFGMSLTGPTFTSHSIAIGQNLPESEKEEKLKNFKLSINTKTKTTAFAFVPVNETDSIDYSISKTEAFRKVFPKLPLTAVYNTNELGQYSIDTSNVDPNPSLEFDNCIAYLIISHS